MSRPPAATAPHAITDIFARSRFLAPFVVYCLFAGVIYFVHGAQPTLNIDHISYMKLANEIRAGSPEGDYWRTFNSVRAYGVLLAYAYDLTGSHLISFKLMLAVLTVAYLFAFQLFMGLVTRSRAEAVMLSLFSALFVSFGASIWGMTDFSASLNRTLIVPFVVLLVWFFFHRFASPWRYAIYPGLMLLSLLHLSALHIFLVFGVFELLDFIILRRFRIDRNLAYFALALAVSAGIHFAIERAGAGATAYVGNLIAMAVPPAEELIAPPSAPPATPPAAPPKTAVPQKLSHDEAWRIELLAFPWRNLPLPLATIAAISLSFGVIFLLAIAGAHRSLRTGQARPLDRQMAVFALAVPIAAFGLQSLLWATRTLLTVLPINFEEVRAINMIMIPAVYFIYRLYELAPPVAGLSQGATRVAIMTLFALQPIVVLKAMPASWREALIHRAVALGVIKSSDSLRMLFARQFLGLKDAGPRFYYSSRPLIAWLERNAKPKDVVLSNLNELHLSGIKSVGPFLTILDYQIWDPKRARWAQSLEAVDRALESRDLGRIRQLALAMGATYVVTAWPVEGAVYRDEYFSVIKVP